MLFRSTFGVFGTSAIIGLYLMWVGGWQIGVLALTAILLGYLYTGGPYPLSYLGLGDIFVLIFFSCVILIIQSQGLKESNQDLYNVLSWFDLIFTILFLMEVLVKSLAMGFVFGEGCYLSDPWNKTDFFIVAISILAIIGNNFNTMDLGFLKALRAARALRPLRMVKRFPSLRTCTEAILLTLPSVANYLLLVLVLYTVFAIVAVSLYGGILGHCSEGEFTTDRADCIQTNSASEIGWIKPSISFDTYSLAML